MIVCAHVRVFVCVFSAAAVIWLTPVITVHLHLPFAFDVGVVISL